MNFVEQMKKRAKDYHYGKLGCVSCGEDIVEDLVQFIIIDTCIEIKKSLQPTLRCDDLIQQAEETK